MPKVTLGKGRTCINTAKLINNLGYCIVAMPDFLNEINDVQDSANDDDYGIIIRHNSNTLKGGRSNKDQRKAENKSAGKYHKRKQLVVSSTSKKRAIRKKIDAWVTGVLGANMDNYKHGNLALLRSFANGVKQNPHTDSAAINEYCGNPVARMSLGIVAFPWQAGRLLFRPRRTSDTEKLEFEAIQVPKGMCIVFRGDWPHAGDSYPRRHDRMHFYLDAKYQLTNKRETNTTYVHPTLNHLYHHKAYKYNLEAHTLYGVRQNPNYAPVQFLFAKKTGRVEWKNYNDMPAAFKKKLTQKLNLTPSSRIGTKQLGDIIEIVKGERKEAFTLTKTQRKMKKKKN